MEVATPKEDVGLLDNTLEIAIDNFEGITQPYKTTNGSGWDVYRLYTSHFLSAWGERMWEFAVALILLRMNPGSLFLVSAEGLSGAILTGLSGGLIGSYVDRTDRLAAACQMYMIQNASISVAGICSYIAISSTSSPAFSVILITTVIACSALSQVASLGSTLSVEKEWTKQLCNTNSERLAQTNAKINSNGHRTRAAVKFRHTSTSYMTCTVDSRSNMRRIDLCCLILSPIVVGLAMTYGSFRSSILFIIAWNIFAWAPECLLLKAAYNQNSAFREPKAIATSALPQENPLAALTSWQLYFKQTVTLQAFSLALVYLTVLSFGSLMTAYLNWAGISEGELSIFRGFGAVCGVLATVIFPRLHRAKGLAVSGSAGIYMQFVCLFLGIAMFCMSTFSWVPNKIALYMLILMIALSRCGLWLFDLSINQMLQDQIDRDILGRLSVYNNPSPHCRFCPAQDLTFGAVNGVQGSLCSIFTALSYVVGLVVSSPDNFSYLMYGSLAVVLVACVLTTFGCHQTGLCDERDTAQQIV